MKPTLPAFQPHPLLRGGHLQTLAGVVFRGRIPTYAATRHEVPLADGDRIVLHDDRPAAWRDGGRAALLVHGLTGSHDSPYMARIAARLSEANVRAFRLDLRNAGAARGLARYPAHAGRSADVLAALDVAGALCPGSSFSVAGFSLGGNIVLKMLGEEPDLVPDTVDRAAAVSPALDLSAAADAVDRPANFVYSRHFVRELNRGRPDGTPPAHSVREFDDLYTGPLSGFRSADHYYEESSAAQFVPRIRAPTEILTAGDDPLVPVAPFGELATPPTVRLHVTASGGHIGWLGRAGVDADRRWMDWRVVEWLTDGDTLPEG